MGPDNTKKPTSFVTVVELVMAVPVEPLIVVIVLLVSLVRVVMCGPAGASMAAAIMPGMQKNRRTAESARVVGMSRIRDMTSIRIDE